MAKFTLFNENVRNVFENDEIKFAAFNKLMLDTANGRFEEGITPENANKKIVEKFKAIIGCDENSTKPEIRKAIAILAHKEGRNLSTRRITISTCGVIKGIYDLADNGPAVRLAISLTTADQELRETLMPIGKTNPLPELSKAIQYYIEKTGNRCTLEAALLSGINTTQESADNLKKFVKNMPIHVNVIPWNPVEGLPYKEPSVNECGKFMKMLEERGINVTQRTRRGRKIGGACGQLGKTVKI